MEHIIIVNTYHGFMSHGFRLMVGLSYEAENLLEGGTFPSLSDSVIMFISFLKIS